MEKFKFKLTSKVLPQSDTTAWCYAVIDKKVSDEIKENFSKDKNPSGSITVITTIKTTTWTTSLILDKTSDTFLLPIKTEIRTKEKIEVGDDISFTIQIKKAMPPQVHQVPEEDSEEEQK